MAMEEKVLEKLRDLPPDKQKAVLDFVESLKRDSGKPTTLLSLEGLWADLDIHIAEEDIAAARQEMWSNFPRDIKL
jgi:EAL domain-containing protein (putative c-di-GMP-specific phosphodiesterase class I)